MKKCTLCVDRIYNETIPEPQRQPACVITCPVGARHFRRPRRSRQRGVEAGRRPRRLDLMPELGYQPVNRYLPPWLSREAVAAVATYVPLAVFGIGWGFYGRGDLAIGLAALLAAIGSIVTVYCTAMIYRSLKPVHQWANPHVVPVYLAIAAMTGALILTALLQVWGRPDRVVAAIAVVATALAVLLKERYWRFIDGAPAGSTVGSATGLGRLGEVRLFEPPHTGSNYLMKEMGFRVARKHALKLRRLALVIGFALPLLLSLCAALIAGPLGALAAVLAAMSALAGMLVERWLFFAEAKHTVTLYYGAATA
jgi:sulfite dehydrogenase (quinone) subunit SoeC